MILVLVLFVVLPLVELVLLLQIGRMIGLVPTLLLVVGTGIGGWALARMEGLRVLRGFQAELVTGRLPGRRAFDGVCILAGGLLLVLPGVLSDLLGLALLFPPTRRLIQAALRRRMERGLRQGTIRVTTLGGFGSRGFGGYGSGEPRRGPAREELGGLDPRKGIEIPPRDDQGS